MEGRMRSNVISWGCYTRGHYGFVLANAWRGSSGPNSLLFRRDHWSANNFPALGIKLVGCCWWRPRGAATARQAQNVSIPRIRKRASIPQLNSTALSVLSEWLLRQSLLPMAQLHLRALLLHIFPWVQHGLLLLIVPPYFYPTSFPQINYTLTTPNILTLWLELHHVCLRK